MMTRNTYGKSAIQHYNITVCMTEVRRGDTMKRVGPLCYQYFRRLDYLTIIWMGSEQEYFDLGDRTY